jgi:hypothetical protein
VPVRFLFSVFDRRPERLILTLLKQSVAAATQVSGAIEEHTVPSKPWLSMLDRIAAN